MSFLRTGLSLTACIKSRDLVDVMSVDGFPSSCNFCKVLQLLVHSQPQCRLKVVVILRNLVIVYFPRYSFKHFCCQLSILHLFISVKFSIRNILYYVKCNLCDYLHIDKQSRGAK